MLNQPETECVHIYIYLRHQHSNICMYTEMSASEVPSALLVQTSY